MSVPFSLPPDAAARIAMLTHACAPNDYAAAGSAEAATASYPIPRDEEPDE